jgi:hypothetical protein
MLIEHIGHRIDGHLRAEQHHERFHHQGETAAFSGPGHLHHFCRSRSKYSLTLVSLGADKVQESVKFLSGEKLSVRKVVEGTVKLSPGRGQRAASLEVIG